MRPDVGRASPEGPARNALATRQGAERRPVHNVAPATDQLTAAMQAAGRSLPVFPCEPGGKRPAVDRWEQRATADLDVIERAWSGRWAGHNIGCPPGRVGCLVVDLDRHAELPPDWRAIPGVRDGADVFAQLLEWAAGQARWPATTWTRTPSGGSHLWFRQPPGQTIRNSAGLLGPGIDVRGHGGYVLLPGSAVGGRAYEVLDDSPPAPCPPWLALRLAPPPRTAASVPAVQRQGPANLRGLIGTVRASQPGQQTDTLVWAAFRLRDEISRGRAGSDDAELLVHAALEAGMRPESYVRYQVGHVLGTAR